MAGFMGGLGFDQLMQQIMARRGSFMPPQAGGGAPLQQMFRQRPAGVQGSVGSMTPLNRMAGMVNQRRPMAAPATASQPTPPPAGLAGATPVGQPMATPAQGLHRRKGWM